MTKPENIEQAFSGTAYPVDAATGKNATIEAVKVALKRLLCPEPEKTEPALCPKCGKPLTIAGNGWNYCKDCDRMGTNTYRASGLPPAPPPSPSPDATEKGGDRAREMADKAIRLMSSCHRISFVEWDRARIEREIVNALRAYGDELLERAAVKTTETVCSDKDCECDDCEAHRHDAQVIRAMKYSATKGAANG